MRRGLSSHLPCGHEILRLGTLCLLLGGLTWTPASGQGICDNFEFEQMPVDEMAKRDFRSMASRSIRNNDLPSGEAANFDRYYNEYFLPRLTSCEEITDATNIRKELKRDLKGLGQGAVHDRLTQLCLNKCQEIVRGNYHPAARVNAMLIINDLNRTEVNTSSNPPQAAAPLPEALPVMLEVLQTEDVPLAVKITALNGLVRHAESPDLAEADRTRIMQAVVPILMAEAPAKEREQEAHDWYRLRAADVLGALGIAGPNNEALLALAQVADESDLNILLGCHVAQAVGSLNYESVTFANPSDLVADLGQFVLDAYEHEKERAEKGMELMSRPGLKYYFYCGSVGLKGEQADQPGGCLALAKNPPHDTFAAEVSRQVDQLLEIFEDEDNRGQRLEHELFKATTALEKLIQRKPKADTETAQVLPEEASEG